MKSFDTVQDKLEEFDYTVNRFDLLEKLNKTSVKYDM